MRGKELKYSRIDCDDAHICEYAKTTELYILKGFIECELYLNKAVIKSCTDLCMMKVMSFPFE